MARGRSSGYEDQRELILLHAAELFAQRGYSATSMNGVAEACGLSKPALYHYFRDKYDLLVNIAENHIVRLQALVSEVAELELEPEARLRELIARKAKGNSRFLACMARNALLRTPPLGFFKDFVVESDRRHTRAINIKRRGTAPLADLVRVHALAIGAQSINSFERLKDIIDAAILPLGRGQDLFDALEFISMVRARHQAEDMAAGVDPDNSIDPEKLSEFERKSLRDAFLILGNAQKFLKYRYQPGRAN